MINPHRIKALLKINGLTTESPDAHIRLVLDKAGYSQSSIEEVMAWLRSKGTLAKPANRSRIEGMHKLFRTTQALQPSEIQDVLGIEVDTSYFVSGDLTSTTTRRTMSVWHGCVIVLLTLLVTGVLLRTLW